jgi:uncharacterized protein YfcZ (UPF0381/DUF406 family)
MLKNPKSHSHAMTMSPLNSKETEVCRCGKNGTLLDNSAEWEW